MANEETRNGEIRRGKSGSRWDFPPPSARVNRIIFIRLDTISKCLIIIQGEIQPAE
jgi:hypothetical protein